MHHGENLMPKAAKRRKELKQAVREAFVDQRDLLAEVIREVLQEFFHVNGKAKSKKVKPPPIIPMKGRTKAEKSTKR